VTRTLTQIDNLLRDENTTELDLRLQLDYLLQKESDLIRLDHDIQTSTSDDDLEGAEEYRLRISHSLTRVRHALDSQVSVPQAHNPQISRPTSLSTEPSPAVFLQLRPQGAAGRSPYRNCRYRLLPGAVATGRGSGIISIVHTNSELPPIEKFKYLLTYLTDDAKRAVEGIRLSEQNYDLAVQTLQDRLGRRDILIDDHIDRLLSLTAVNSSTNAVQLRKLYDAIRFRTTSLQGLDVPPSNYAVVLHRVLMRCLPADLTILYRQKLKEAALTPSADTPDMRPEEEVRVIMLFLQTQVEIREDVQIEHPCHSPRCGSSPIPSLESVQASHPSALTLSTEAIGYRVATCPLYDTT
ncbi:hypothetical protein HPB47_024288, partial [Ixodes persulcatus]